MKTLSTKAHFDYDKHIFSQYIKEGASQVDFSGFTELLTRLQAVIRAHK